MAMKGRSSAQRCSDREEKTDSSISEPDVEVPPEIFLSHSGRQKAFVEHLNSALRAANHTPFFDMHSLPKGSPFPPHLKRAARGCKLGVVVLSDDFLTSKWPMLELEMLVLQRGPDPRVLPLFYRLRPEDLKSPTNLSRWRCTWREKVGQQQADRWEEAVKKLDAFNGDVFVQGTSEIAYIKKVVNHICTLVPCHAPYDLSSMQGHQRLAQVVARHFEHVAKASRCKQACMVGLHGVGGLGKTTLCKSLVNFYISRYLGRSCLLEFPTDGDELKIVQECTKALKKLTNLRNDCLLNEVYSFDQVVQLMMEHVRKYDVFLAIDNVWENSLEEAKRLLGVGFSADSKILLTSRSEQVLQDLLIKYTDTKYIGPLPAPEREEAFQIFQKNFELCDLSSLKDTNQIKAVLQRCNFSGSYHPLALKALGHHVKRVCSHGDLERIEHHLSLILEELCNADMQNLEDVIKLNYEILPQHKQHMFLDIAVFILPIFKNSSYASVVQWLGFLYKQFSETKIFRLINELALDGLIQIENDKYGEKMIRVHDLFVDVAQREAASSSRYFTELSTQSVDWAELARVILEDDEGSSFIEKLQHQECPKLQLLFAANIKCRGGIHLDLMPSLRTLILSGVIVGPSDTNPSVPSLEGMDAARIVNLNGLVQLQVLRLQHCNFVNRITGLNTLQNLQIIYIKNSPDLENLDGLSCLIRLLALEVESCASLKKVPDLGGLTCLATLRLSGNESMEEVGCLSSALKEVAVEWCGVLTKLPDLGGLTRLERLQLCGNDLMEEVGCLSSALKEVAVEGCGALMKLPDLGGLTRLERLQLSWNKSMEEVGCLSSALKEVRVEQCGALTKLPDLGGLTRLERLWLSGNESMEEVGCLSSALKEVTVEGCGALKKLPDLGGLTRLESLRLSGNESMEEVGCLSSALTEVTVERCRALTKLPDLGGLTRLERLRLFWNESMEDVVGDLRGLHSLEEVVLKNCPKLKVVGLEAISTRLKHLSVESCGCLDQSYVAHCW